MSSVIQAPDLQERRPAGDLRGFWVGAGMRGDLMGATDHALVVWCLGLWEGGGQGLCIKG